MKFPIALLPTLLPAGIAFAQSEDPNNLVFAEGDNPANWCRNGHFPKLTSDYRLGKILRPSAMLSDQMETCPSEDPGKCEVDKMVEAGVSVAVSKRFGDFYCVFDPRDYSAGWLAGKNISFVAEKETTDSDWIGDWSDGTNKITIEMSGKGLHVTGQAQWYGATLDDGEQVVHEGGLEFVAKPSGNRLALRVEDEYDCAAELINLGKFLIVRDNGNCGGANVGFSSVYQRK